MIRALLSTGLRTAQTLPRSTLVAAPISSLARFSSTQTAQDKPTEADPNSAKGEPSKQAETSSLAERKKTVAEEDEELRLKLEGLAGDGGSSGLEYEDGKAVSMKRGVRENMFRYI